MKTNQVTESKVDRALQVGNTRVIIRQRTKDSFFALKDILRVATLVRLVENKDSVALHIDKYFALDATKDFIETIKEKKGIDPYIRARGRGKESWVHPYLLIDILLWANPSFKLEVYEWLNDFLIHNRISSGDSWNVMCGALYNNIARKVDFPKMIKEVGFRIKQLLGVSEWNKASSEQLKRREDAQMFIADLAETLKNSKEAVRIGFLNLERKQIVKIGDLAHES